MDYPDYDPLSRVTPLNAAELDALDSLLQNLPADGAMTLDGLDGYLTALLAGPPELLATLPGAQWLPVIWGGDGEAGNAGAAPFASKRQRKSTVVMVLRHLRHLGQVLAESPDEWQPIFSVAEQGPREWADARDWCAGFMQAVDLRPAAWDPFWADSTLGPALAPLVSLGGGLEGATGLDPAHEGAPDLDDPELCDRLSRTVPEAVLRLLAHRGPAP